MQGRTNLKKIGFSSPESRELCWFGQVKMVWVAGQAIGHHPLECCVQAGSK